ncbi:GTPase, partial [Cardiosporidium cionae]
YCTIEWHVTDSKLTFAEPEIYVPGIVIQSTMQALATSRIKSYIHEKADVGVVRNDKSTSRKCTTSLTEVAAATTSMYRNSFCRCVWAISRAPPSQYGPKRAAFCFENRLLFFIESLVAPQWRSFSIMQRYNRSLMDRPAKEETLIEESQSDPSLLVDSRDWKGKVQDERMKFRHSDELPASPYYGFPNLTRGALPSEVQFSTWTPPTQPENPHTLKVAIVGPPNSGKSSLLNALTNTVVSSVSPKVNTTRSEIRGILTEDNHQVVFIDAPGKFLKILCIIPSHGKRSFSRSLLSAAWRGYEEADICLFVVDCVKRPLQEVFEIVRTIAPKPLKSKDIPGNPLNPFQAAAATLASRGNIAGISAAIHANRLVAIGNSQLGQTASASTEDILGQNFLPPVCLLLNKMDLSKHSKFLTWRLREFEAQGKFEKSFFISAKHQKGLNFVKEYLKNISKPNPWLYPPTLKTTLSKVEQVEQIIRTYLFCWFNKDVPYRIEQKTVGWTEATDGSVIIEQELLVHDAKVAKMICGIRNRLLWQLRKNSIFKLQQLWDRTVFLYIHVKVVGDSSFGKST